MEEPDNEWRICLTCAESNEVDYKLALNEHENHNGLAVKEMQTDITTNNKNLYLGGSYKKILDTLAFETNCSTLPLLKNGSNMTLELVIIDKNRYFFKFTCALDSLIQILLAAAADYPNIKGFIITLLAKSRFFELVSHILGHGVTTYAYRLRGRVYLAYKKISPEVATEPIGIECDTAVNDLHRFSFHSMSSFQKTMKCGARATVAITSGKILLFIFYKYDLIFF